MRPPPLDPLIHLSRSRQRGSVILFVLGMILLTSFLLTRFINRAHTELLTEARKSLEAPLRDEAYSALQVSLAVLADIASVDGGLHSPDQGWGDPIAYADYVPPEGLEVTVQITDESGKFSLAQPKEEALRGLFESLGLLPLDAERVIDTMFTWTLPDHAAKFNESDEATYSRMDPPLTLPQKPLRTLEELRLMPAIRQFLCDEAGHWNETGQRFLQNVSLFAFDQVNLNTASEEVLRSLGLDDNVLARRSARSDSPADRRSAIFYTRDDAATALGNLPDSASLGVSATGFRVMIIANQGGRKFQLEAIVRLGGRAPAPSSDEEVTSEPRPWTRNSIDSPFRILEIRENNGF